MANKHLEAFKQKHLKTSEEVLAWCDVYMGELFGNGDNRQRDGVLLVTADRVAFYRKGFLGEIIETIPLKSITSIERKSILGHNTVRLHTSHDSLTFKTFKKPDEILIVDAIEAGRGTTSLASTKPETSPVELLKKLGELRESGVITEDEFQAKKTDLLTRM